MNLEDVQILRRGFLLLFSVAIFALFAVSAGRPFFSGSREIVTAAGWFLIIVCILGRTWCSLYIGGKKISQLVTAGPYSVCRNPLYFFSILGSAGVGMQTGSLLLGLSVALSVAAVFHIVVQREERALLDLHGPSYADYLRAVPRLIPDLSLWKGRTDGQYDSRLVRRTFFDASIFLIAIPYQIAIRYLQLHDILPVLLRLP